jgi:molybdopterin-containing oxidoreductase family iron-sulfur binding subunit
MKRKPIDPELLRDRLAAEQGKQYWRSLDELAGDPAVTAMLQREFPDGASEWTDPVSRRQFLMLMGASLALAGATGCRPPTGKVIPFVRPPEDNRIPGKALYFATAMPLGGFATGLLVESNEGRPTKIEGNPLQSTSLGGTSPLHQAATLGLYDPDRSRAVMYRQQLRNWSEVIQVLRRRLTGDKSKGEGFAIVTDTIGSPTLAAQIDEFKKQYPAVKFYRHEPVNDDNALLGSELAFGRRVHSYAKLENADVIVSLDSNFLAEGPGHLVYSRAFAKRRRLDDHGHVGGERGMNRLYVIETDLTVTGANADNRLALKPSDVEAFAFALAAKLGVAGAEAPKLSEEATKYVEAIAKDLKARKPGSTIVMVGEGVSPAIHAVGHAINAALGNVGQTVVYTDPLLPQKELANQSIRDFAAALGKGEIDTVVFMGTNPAYSSPADLNLGKVLAEELKKTPNNRKSKKEWLAVHLGLYFDETARLCHWHIPQVHFLEDWSDGVGLDGSVSIIQPLIAPLYDGKSAHDLIGSLTKLPEGEFDERSTFDLVRNHWKKLDDNAWVKAVHDGVVPGAATTITPTLAADLFKKPGVKPRSPSGKGLELVLAPEAGVYDGRFANNGWLQEWPRPLSRLTWDNALMMSPATAEKLNVGTRIRMLRSGGEHGEQAADMVQIKVGKNTLDVPIWIMPGHADGAVTLHLGYGRTHAGKVGTGYGFNAYQLRSSESPWVLDGVEITRLNKEYMLACVQGHHSMEGRDLVRSDTLHAFEEFDKDKNLKDKLKKKGLSFATRHDHLVGFEKKEGSDRATPLTLYQKHQYPGYRWGMAIDLSACTGCGSCVVACQAENNSPVIGKTEVTRGREMHWLRIDRYFKTGKPEEKATDPLEVHFQPVMCQHCEQAPCELVCPVEATAHGDEGTNDMVYNRCVGTRYCANNCPYKVRRFNFFPYADYETPSLKLAYNPEVTVRTRGVIEKCTFCIQRIAYARIEAAKEAMDELSLPAEQRTRRDTNGEDGKPRLHDGKEIPLVRDGEVQTACQTACPSEAIIFGDLNDKKSKVAAMASSPLSYGLMGELGTRPRVSYLAQLRNPNPELTPEKKHEGHH